MRLTSAFASLALLGMLLSGVSADKKKKNDIHLPTDDEMAQGHTWDQIDRDENGMEKKNAKGEHLSRNTGQPYYTKNMLCSGKHLIDFTKGKNQLTLQGHQGLLCMQKGGKCCSRTQTGRLAHAVSKDRSCPVCWSATGKEDNTKDRLHGVHEAQKQAAKKAVSLNSSDRKHGRAHLKSLHKTKKGIKKAAKQKKKDGKK